MAPLPVLSTANARGFTLVEMLVVLAIIAVITMVTLFGHSNFDRSLLITDTAYSLALSIREMQTYGLSSRKFSGVTNAGYGVHIAQATPGSYILFADTSAAGGIPAHCPVGAAGTPEAKPGNCIYDISGPADGVVQTYNLTRGFTISDFCGKDVSGTRRCKSSGYLQAMDAIFIRPNTQSVVSGQRTVAGTPWIQLVTGEIYLLSPDGTATRGICISQVGQISVTTGTCP